MRPTPWLLRRPCASPRARLFCFSYAGGSPGMYLAWQGRFDPAVEVCSVQLPGRGARFNERAPTDIASLVATLAAEIDAASDLPFYFFGHSLGGLLAFEVARALSARSAAMPGHLFVSGCGAPRQRTPARGYGALDAAALLEKLKNYDGTPPEALANDELMQVLLPAIRADFMLGDGYIYAPDPPLAIALTVLAGTADRFVSSAQVAGWRAETSGPCRIAWFDGGHFFIHSRRDDVLDCISKVLAPELAPL